MLVQWKIDYRDDDDHNDDCYDNVNNYYTRVNTTSKQTNAYFL